MTAHRPFEPRDVPATGFGFAFGLFYGVMGVLLIAFMFEGAWIMLLLGLPFLIVQIAVILLFDRFLKWRARNDPPPPPTAWIRQNAMAVGAVLGIAIGLVTRALNGPLLGTSP